MAVDEKAFNMHKDMYVTTGYDDSQVSTQLQNTQMEQQDVVCPVAKLIPVRINEAIVDIYEGVSYSFGRAKECSIQLDEVYVSKVHCCVWYDNRDREVKIWDNSSNGTYINKKRLNKGSITTLTHGDWINISKMNAGIAYSFMCMRTQRSFDEDAEHLMEAGYDLKEFIGKGGFSMVYKGVRLLDGKICAVKIINKFNIPDNDALLKREIDIIQKLSHPNIIEYIDYVECVNSHCIVLEFAEGGELFNILKKNGPFSEHAAKELFYQIASAVDYLHGQGIAHRDLKPENILLNDMKVKLADFGFARLTSDLRTMKTFCGTPNYIAPEILSMISAGEGHQDGYTTAVDMWSLGVILFLTLTGCYPFDEFNTNDPPLPQPNNFHYKYPGLPAISEDAKDLISRLLSIDPQKRPSSSEVLAHPWLR